MTTDLLMCAVQRCQQPAHLRDFCRLHYQRKMRNGSTDLNPNYNGEGHQGKGLGVIECSFCDKPVRDHKIGPCPVAGVQQFRGGAGIVEHSAERQEYRRRNRY